MFKYLSFKLLFKRQKNILIKQLIQIFEVFEYRWRKYRCKKIAIIYKH